MKAFFAAALAAALTAGAALAQEDAPPPAGNPDLAALETELETLRAREGIRELLHAYGRTIDARDFDAFAELWAGDAEYVGGPNATPVAGPRAIADFLEEIIGANPAGYGEPNFHILFNEHIEVLGPDRARGTSMSAFAVPSGGTAELAILARYEDEYVMEDGRWKFQRRVVRGAIPGGGG